MIRKDKSAIEKFLIFLTVVLVLCLILLFDTKIENSDLKYRNDKLIQQNDSLFYEIGRRDELLDIFAASRE